MGSQTSYILQPQTIHSARRGGIESTGQAHSRESDNRELKSKKPRQIYCYAISAKRYALFVKNRRGEPALLRSKKNNEDDRWSEHGLGHLLNPMDIKTKNGIEVENQYREWIAEISLNIIRKALGNTTHRLYFEKYPAIGKIAVSSPAVMKSLNFYNEGKPYSQQIKPFNFLLTCNVRELGHPIGSDPERLHFYFSLRAGPSKVAQERMDRPIFEGSLPCHNSW